MSERLPNPHSLSQTLIRGVIKTGLRVSFKVPSRLPLPIQALRQGMEAGAGLLPVRSDVVVESLNLAGVPAEKVSFQSNAGTIILHLHGGAFMVGSPRTHRGLAAELAARCEADVFVPDYRLGPEHPYPAALDDCLASWQALAERYGNENIVVSGDSAGGALVLNLALALRDKNLPLPKALVLMSPYTDSSLQTPSVNERSLRDPMLTNQALKRGSNGYRGKLALDDERISPLYASLVGLPPVLIQVGTEEVLHDDALALHHALEAAEVSSTFQCFGGMWHDFQLFSRFVHEADVALDEIASFIHHD